MFDLNGISYPVRFANYQRNSFVALEPRVSGEAVWSKKWFEINPNLNILPMDILLSGNYIGIRDGTSLLLLDDRGKFVKLAIIGENTPVVFAGKTFACLNHAFLLEYTDYDGTRRLEKRPVPSMEAFTGLILFRPKEDDFLVATHFTGGPSREKPRFYVCRTRIEEIDPQWYYTGDGRLDQALLTSDEKTLVTIRENKVTTLNPENGDKTKEFETGYAGFLSASLDLDNNLVMIGRVDPTGWILKKTSLTGEEIWSYRLSDPKPFQPPACGPDDRVYVADGIKVICLAGGKTIWEKIFPGGHPLLTICAGNAAVILDSGILYVLDNKGETIARLVLTQSDELFEAAPAIDAAGRIYAAGTEKLYRME